MELKKLKARLKTAQRGHKLLKDKTDEMVRRFSVLAREIKKLRAETEGDVVRVLKQFSLARGLMPKKDIELLFSMPSVSVEPECGLGNFMNLEAVSYTHLDHGGYRLRYFTLCGRVIAVCEAENRQRF